MTLFSTSRLVVRPFTINDADIFFLINGNEEVMRYIRPVTSRAETDRFLQWNIDYYGLHPNLGRFAVHEAETGNFVGSFALLYIHGNTGGIHTGYAFLPEAWGKGYATELAGVGIDFFFKQQRGNVLFAIVEKLNTASQNVLVKCGFQLHSSYMEEEKEVLKYFIERKQGQL